MGFTINDIDLIRLKKIGLGWEYDVFELDSERVLKVSRGYHLSNSGRILEELQGLPFIPKVFEYGEDWLIMQKIVGLHYNLYASGYSYFAKKYSYEQHRMKTLAFCKGCLEKGYVPRDLGATNVMIDTKGDFWIVDVGAFIKKDYSTIPYKLMKSLLMAGKSLETADTRIHNIIEMIGLEWVLKILKLDKEEITIDL